MMQHTNLKHYGLLLQIVISLFGILTKILKTAIKKQIDKKKKIAFFNMKFDYYWKKMKKICLLVHRV